MKNKIKTKEAIINWATNIVQRAADIRKSAGIMEDDANRIIAEMEKIEYPKTK